MRILIKIGAGMALLAIILVGVCFGTLRAHAANEPVVAGSREVKTETRQIDAQVVNIEGRGPVDLIIKQGSTPSMSVTAEERLLPLIKTTQQGNTLVVDFRESGFHFNHPMHVTLVLPNLQQVSLHGSGDARVSGFSGDKLALALNGSGDMDFDGNYQHVSAKVMGSGDLDLAAGNGTDADFSLLGSGGVTVSGQNKSTVVRIMGSGDLDAERLHTDDLKIDVMGSGDATVYAKQSAVVHVQGSGDVEVHGNPSRREVSRNGSGDVNWES